MLSTYVGLFLLSAAALAFQVTLTRVFSVAQWYHFAFMSVSIALLGLGASGSFLYLLPGLARRAAPRLLAGLSALFALGVVAGYLTINYIPFDSYCIAWERVQLLYLALYYLSLTLPSFFSGLVLGILLAARPELAGRLYSFNMAGSGLGCLAAVAALPLLGGAGTVMLSASLGALAAVAFSRGWRPRAEKSGFRPLALGALYLLMALALLFLAVHPPPLLEVRLSPYKGLSQALRYPGARVVFSRWNAFSRVDVLESEGVKSAPG